MMARRFESYKTHVVKPFFRDHFARLDRQIVLVDVLAALNAGPDAVQDLERALAEILTCFRPGKNSWLAGILSRRRSTGSSSRRPRRTICTTPATTGWRRFWRR